MATKVSGSLMVRPSIVLHDTGGKRVGDSQDSQDTLKETLPTRQTTPIAIYVESQQDVDEEIDVPLYFLGAGERSAAVAELKKIVGKGRPRLRHLDHAARTTGGAFRMYSYATQARQSRRVIRQPRSDLRGR